MPLPGIGSRADVMAAASFPRFLADLPCGQPGSTGSNIGALIITVIITYTNLGVPYDNYSSTTYPQALL